LENGCATERSTAAQALGNYCPHGQGEPTEKKYIPFRLNDSCERLVSQKKRDTNPPQRGKKKPKGGAAGRIGYLWKEKEAREPRKHAHK